MAFYQFSVPVKIIHNEGVSRDFANEAALLGIARPFAVTDKFLLDSGLCEPIFAHLRESGIEIAGVFSEVPPDGSVACVTACAAKAKACGADSFLAIGGGSVMDTAKGANVLFTLGGDLKADYAGAQTINAPLSPLVAIPTTAGTGSEVTEAIVIYDEESKSKLSFVDSHLLPSLAVLDPELTVGLPPLLTAATGLDALTHAVESALSVQNNPVSDALACRAVSLIRENLPRAVKNGGDLEARSATLTASTLAGMAFNHAMVGVVHAAAHAVGAVSHVHHGTANGVFLPFGLEYNLSIVPERIAFLAPSFGVAASGTDAAARGVIAAVRSLIGELNSLCAFPRDLEAAGVKEADLPAIAELAAQDGAGFYNPREVTAEDLLPFLRRAFGSKK